MREKIVGEATKLLAVGGRDAVSTRAVATAAGTQAPTIYRLFGDKDGLLAALLDHGFTTYLEAKPPVDPDADPLADLRDGWDLHLDFGLTNPALFALMYGEPRSSPRPAAAEAGIAILRDRVRALAAAGRLAVSEDLAVQMIHAAGSGLVLAMLAIPADQRDPLLSDAMFSALVAAITTDDITPPLDGPVPAANALRAQLSDLNALTPGERHVLDEWLTRITTQ
ncbi:TetR/AcrR family transcriptional regulator [Kribbella antibiotica]|uniref:TetR/AcrR family transcriptional regulator n=2 Tax=Kribbella antibiotica TaxID=190195 RepID=A0A4R4ZQY1_9ACTN|nr:TetR/AcrR family transcriptional regulator [Kribbella antibiotica]